jgi:hypothetical protein
MNDTESQILNLIFQVFMGFECPNLELNTPQFKVMITIVTK